MYSSSSRRFLFLQGMATSFFARLGEALVSAGHEVRRINFNGGDRVFWPLPGAVDFRGSQKAWSRFLQQRLDTWGTTDIILFGDCRPLHRIAIALAVGRGIDIHVFEEGYLRPNWVTLEAGGVNGHSSLPRDIDWYMEAAQATPRWTGGEPVASSFPRRAWEDVLYNVATVAMSPLYPGYRTHRPWSPLVEYVGWLPRLVRHAAASRRHRREYRAALDIATEAFLFPLQLDCDSQIRRHSGLRGMSSAIDQVIASFAHAAPPNVQLIVKEHPLDNGLVNWRRRTAAAARRHGVAERVTYVTQGRIEPFLERVRGVVTVNSTSGLLALAFGRPVATLGHAIYALPRLTHQRPLDCFWTECTPPDETAFEAFRRVVAAKTQVNGGFFSEQGVRMAVEGALVRLRAHGEGRAAAISRTLARTPTADFAEPAAAAANAAPAPP